MSNFNVTVPAATEAWVPGPTMRLGESLRVQCSNSVSNGTNGGGTMYAFPEGTYPLDLNDPTPAYDPSAVAQFAIPNKGSGFPVDNTVPGCLGMAVCLDGNVPSFDITNGLRPNRDTTYLFSDLQAAAGVWNPDAVLRTFFIFNDQTGTFADNTGSFAVTLTRTGGDMGNVSYKSKERPQFGIESTFGAGIAATRTFSNVEDKGFELSPDNSYEDVSLVGFGFTTGDILTQLKSKGSLKGFMDPQAFGYWLLSRYGAPVITNLASGAYQHVCTDAAYIAISPKSFAIEAVDDNSGRPFKANGIIIPGFKVEAEAGKIPKLSATLMGGDCQGSGVTPSAGQNMAQSVTANGAPTSGTFTLVDDDSGASVVINYASTLTASSVQTSVRTLGGDYTSATVSGSNGGPFTVTSPTGKFMKLLTAVYTDASGNPTLTGGTDMSITVALVTPGGMKLDTPAPLGPLVAISFADSLADLDNSPYTFTENYKLSIDIGEGIEQRYLLNATTLEPNAVGQKDASGMKDAVTLNAAWDDSLANFITASEALTNEFCYGRLKWKGAQIGTTGFYYTVMYEFCCRPKWTANGEANNVRDADFSLPVHMDPSTGFRSRWTVICSKADFTAN